MESLSFDGTKSAARFDSSYRKWNLRRLATYSIFAATVLLALGIAAAQDSEAGKASFSNCQACRAVGTGAKNKLGPELNGLVRPHALETIAAGTPGQNQNLAAYAKETA
jgi:cytochrome c2